MNNFTKVYNTISSNNYNQKELSVTDRYENWKNYDSKKIFEEAMKRLNVDEQRCRNRNLTNFGTDFLVAEKNKVKSELKKFDTDFYEIFKWYPKKNEKETIRNEIERGK